MKLDYHPLHVIVIHFPSALFPMDLLYAGLGYYLQNEAFNYAAYYALAAGVLIGWVAMVLGLIDLVRIPEENKAASRIGLMHGFINTLVLTGYSVLFMLQLKTPHNAFYSVPQLLVKGLLVLGLIGGNYLGGQLVLKYRIGTVRNDN